MGWGVFCGNAVPTVQIATSCRFFTFLHIFITEFGPGLFFLVMSPERELCWKADTDSRYRHFI